MPTLRYHLVPGTTGTVVSILLQKAENGRKVGLLWGA